MRLWPVTGLIIGTLLSAAPAMAESALSLYKAEYKTKVAGLNVTLTRTLTAVSYTHLTLPTICSV